MGLLDCILIIEVLLFGKYAGDCMICYTFHYTTMRYCIASFKCLAFDFMYVNDCLRFKFQNLQK